MIITDAMLRNAIVELNEAKMASLPEPSACNHVFSANFERKIAKLIRKTKYSFVYTSLRRVACILVSLLIAGSMLVAFNPTVRAVVVDWIEERFGDYYHFFYAGEKEPDGTVGSDSASGSTVPNETTVPDETTGNDEVKSFTLGWVSDGTTFVTSIPDEFGEMSIYTDAEGNMVQFIYIYGSDDSSLYAGVGEYEEKRVVTEDFEYTILFALDSEHSNAIIWPVASENVICSISGFLGEEDLVKMAKSLIISKNN